MSNTDFKRLKELANMAQNASKQLDPLIKGFSESLDIAIKNVPDEHKGEVEKVKSIFNKSFNLAKEGKTSEATEIIKNFKHGCKNS